MTIFKTQIENTWHASCYIMAIIFYLGFFEKKSRDRRYIQVSKDQRAPMMMAQAQQT